MADAAITAAPAPNANRSAPAVSLVGACWTLYTLTLRQHLHGRRWLAIVALFLLPAALALVVQWTAPQVPPLVLEFMLVMMFIPQAILPTAALLYASGIIQDEQEEQTITYLLLRPIPKWAIYTIKLLAAMTTTAVLTMVFTALTFATIYAGTNIATKFIVTRCITAALIHSLAVISYCSLFGLLSLVTRWILAVGVLYTAVVEGLLANLPFGIRLITVIYYTRLIAYRTMEFTIPRSNGRSEDLAAVAWQFDVASDPGLTEHPSVRACILVLLVANLVCIVVAGWLCSQREFHVKTPEKN